MPFITVHDEVDPQFAELLTRLAMSYEWTRLTAQQIQTYARALQVAGLALDDVRRLFGRAVAECRRILNRSGYTTTTDKGSVVARPEVRVLNAALTHLHRYAVEFGFSPASLSRVKPIPKEKDVDPMEALLSGG